MGEDISALSRWKVSTNFWKMQADWEVITDEWVRENYRLKCIWREVKMNEKQICPRVTKEMLKMWQMVRWDIELKIAWRLFKTQNTEQSNALPITLHPQAKEWLMIILRISNIEGLSLGKWKPLLREKRTLCVLSFVHHPAKQSTSSLVHLQVEPAGQWALPATQGFYCLIQKASNMKKRARNRKEEKWTQREDIERTKENVKTISINDLGETEDNACINQEQDALEKLKYQGRTFGNKYMYNIQKCFF